MYMFYQKGRVCSRFEMSRSCELCLETQRQNMQNRWLVDGVEMWCGDQVGWRLMWADFSYLSSAEDSYVFCTSEDSYVFCTLECTYEFEHHTFDVPSTQYCYRSPFKQLLIVIWLMTTVTMIMDELVFPSLCVIMVCVVLETKLNLSCLRLRDPKTVGSNVHPATYISQNPLLQTSLDRRSTDDRPTLDDDDKARHAPTNTLSRTPCKLFWLDLTIKSYWNHHHLIVVCCVDI